MGLVSKIRVIGGNPMGTRVPDLEMCLQVPSRSKPVEITFCCAGNFLSPKRTRMPPELLGNYDNFPKIEFVLTFKFQ